MAAVPNDNVRVAASMLLAERMSAEVVGWLADAGIRSILFKGPLQQQWLSPAGAPRGSVDIDLLVAPEDAAAAGRVLSNRGYALVPEVTPGVDQHGHLWAAPGRIPVEVHWTLSGTDPARTWAVLERETETTVAGGRTVEVPNEAARCAIVALHAAQHGRDGEGPLHDLARAIVVVEFETWRRAADIADAAGGGNPFVGGLALVAEGERVRSALGLPLPRLTGELALSHLPVQGAAGFHWLTRQSGPRATARFVARKVVPPAGFMRFKHPWARRSKAHLFAAYLYRFAWIARWAGPGLRAWYRARTAERQGRVLRR